jgi:hypothetical protein
VGGQLTQVDKLGPRKINGHYIVEEIEWWPQIAAKAVHLLREIGELPQVVEEISEKVGSDVRNLLVSHVEDLVIRALMKQEDMNPGGADLNGQNIPVALENVPLRENALKIHQLIQLTKLVAAYWESLEV